MTRTEIAMPARIRLLPNQPVTVALVDPEGEYDFELQAGRYQTTTGRELILPRSAVIALNECAPAPGEEITICRYDRRGRSEWTVSLAPSSEKARAQEEPSELAEALQESIAQAQNEKRAKEAVTPIRRKPAAKQDDQPRLFDRNNHPTPAAIAAYQRGTGTDGPAPQPAPAARLAIATKTPYGQMLRAIVRTVESVLKAEGLQLGDGPKQDLISTVYIDAAKRQGVEYDFTEGQ